MAAQGYGTSPGRRSSVPSKAPAKTKSPQPVIRGAMKKRGGSKKGC